jgi:hypothetical protein
VGLIAREIEARGIPTLSMTSALSITRAVNPPRAAFVDFPLGHTTGKPHDPEGQYALVEGAMEAFETLEAPGGVVSLPAAWDEDGAWKEALLRPQERDVGSDDDERTARLDTPQYQSERDRELAETALAEGGCPGCVFLDAD